MVKPNPDRYYTFDIWTELRVRKHRGRYVARLGTFRGEGSTPNAALRAVAHHMRQIARTLDGGTAVGVEPRDPRDGRCVADDWFPPLALAARIK